MHHQHTPSPPIPWEARLSSPNQMSFDGVRDGGDAIRRSPRPLIAPPPPPRLREAAALAEGLVVVLLLDDEEPDLRKLAASCGS